MSTTSDKNAGGRPGTLHAGCTVEAHYLRQVIITLRRRSARLNGLRYKNRAQLSAIYQWIH